MDELQITFDQIKRILDVSEKKDPIAEIKNKLPQDLDAESIRALMYEVIAVGQAVNLLALQHSENLQPELKNE